MAAQKVRSETFPRISTRIVNGEREPYLPATGLSVWEIVWLSRAYGGDMPALEKHLAANPITRGVIEEALAYARAFPDEIDPVVREVEEMTVERLKELLQGIRPSPPDPETPA
jgi:hypothetical protein